MGLDSFIHYQCSFRPDGDVARVQHLTRRPRRALALGDGGGSSPGHEDVPPDGVDDRHGPAGGARAMATTIRRTDPDLDAITLRTLADTCVRCPAGVMTAITGAAPGCRARVEYPIDEVALEVAREALELTAWSAEPGGPALLRSLVAAGDCDGRRMLQVLASVGAEPSLTGLAPVDVTVDGRAVAITVYMVLEHLFFRPVLDHAATAAVLDWFRYHARALGHRIAPGPEPADECSAALFARSRSLVELAAFQQLVRRAHDQGWSVVLTP